LIYDFFDEGEVQASAALAAFADNDRC